MFPDEVIFENLSSHECLSLLDRRLAQVTTERPFFKSEQSEAEFLKAIGLLLAFPSWSNAIDIEQLARRMARCISDEVCEEGVISRLSKQSARGCISDMFRTKLKRAGHTNAKSSPNATAGQAAGAKRGGSLESQAMQEHNPVREEEAEIENTHKKEAKNKDKSRTVAEVLREMAPCEAGYDKGGSHTISDAEIAAKM